MTVTGIERATETFYSITIKSDYVKTSVFERYTYFQNKI